MPLVGEVGVGVPTRDGQGGGRIAQRLIAPQIGYRRNRIRCIVRLERHRAAPVLLEVGRNIAVPIIPLRHRIPLCLGGVEVKVL